MPDQPGCIGMEVFVPAYENYIAATNEDPSVISWGVTSGGSRLAGEAAIGQLHQWSALWNGALCYWVGTSFAGDGLATGSERAGHRLGVPRGRRSRSPPPGGHRHAGEQAVDPRA